METYEHTHEFHEITYGPFPSLLSLVPLYRRRSPRRKGAKFYVKRPTASFRQIPRAPILLPDSYGGTAEGRKRSSLCRKARAPWKEMWMRDRIRDEERDGAPNVASPQKTLNRSSSIEAILFNLRFETFQFRFYYCLQNLHLWINDIKNHEYLYFILRMLSFSNNVRIKWKNISQFFLHFLRAKVWFNYGDCINWQIRISNFLWKT